MEGEHCIFFSFSFVLWPVLTHLSSQRIILSQRVVKSFDLLFSTWQNITSLFEVFNVVLSIFMNCRCNSFSAVWRKTCYRCLRYILKTVAEGMCEVRGKKPMNDIETYEVDLFFIKKKKQPSGWMVGAECLLRSACCRETDGESN